MTFVRAHGKTWNTHGWFTDMAVLLQVTLNVDIELPDGTSVAAIEAAVTATRERVAAALDAVDVSVADWWTQ